jgi:hypothetical protein
MSPLDSLQKNLCLSVKERRPGDVGSQFNSTAITVWEDAILYSASFTVYWLRSNSVKLDFMMLFVGKMQLLQSTQERKSGRQVAMTTDKEL